MKLIASAALVALAALFAPACAAEPGPAVDPAIACAERGGEIRPAGRAGTPRCVVAYKDAGKACTDGDDCEGDCWTGAANGAPDAAGVAHGQCQPNDLIFGCHAAIEDGKAGVYMCVD